MIEVVKGPKKYQVVCSNCECAATLQFNAGDVKYNFDAACKYIVCPICEKEIRVDGVYAVREVKEDD